MARYGTFQPVQSQCPHCGDATDREARQYAIAGVSVAITFCKHCESAFHQLSDEEKEIISYQTDTNGVVTDITLPYSISRDVQSGMKVLKPVDDFDPSDFDPESKQVIGDAYEITTEKVCAVCEGQAAGDCQLLGKIVCQTCFSEARNGKVDEYRKVLQNKYNNEDLRDYEDEDTDGGVNTDSAPDPEVHSRESESEEERPEDYEEWSLEQWKAAYVDGEINIIALEIGVEHVLEQEMDLDGPGSEKFERSVEIATELSDGQIKEAV